MIIAAVSHMRPVLCLAAALCLPLIGGVNGYAMAEPAAATDTRSGERIAAGTFAPRLTPIASGDPAIAAMAIVKTFEGDLVGTSTGTMLSAGDPAKGSAGYVAIERVTGTLADRHGTFALQHSGTMDAGSSTLVVTVVPGSGGGELAGLAGTMTIAVAADGRHSYTLRYTLPR